MNQATHQASDLENGFEIGSWRVDPYRNAITREQCEKHLENRPMRTLLFLAQYQGQVVSREQLLGSVWHGRVVNEEALSRAVSLLRTALEDDAHRPSFIQTIPGKGYRLIAQVVPVSSSGRRADPVIATDQNSIAVLPFVNLSDDPSNEYFSDGISEEILNSLARARNFKVVGRTSSFAFKNRNEDLREIGKALDASHVLEGSVRKAGVRARITAQLISTGDGYHMWSETFDFELDDIFAVQDKIAASVVEALKVHILGELPGVPETDPQAYASYLRGIYFLRSGEVKRIEKGLSLFQETISIDPDYAPAWVGVADAYWYLISYGVLTKQEFVPLALEASAQALELDDQLAEAHLCKAVLTQNFEIDWGTALSAIDRARQLSPGNARVIMQAGNLASSIGNHQESVTLLSEAIALDPLNTTGHIWLALSLMALDRFHEARATMAQVLEVNPQRVVANLILGTMLLAEGRPEEAHEYMQKEPEGFWREFGLTRSLHALNLREAADKAMNEFVRNWALEAPFQIAELHAFRGDHDAAFHWLDKALELRDNGITELMGSVSLRPIREDPRWPAFVRRMGYPDTR